MKIILDGRKVMKGYPCDYFEGIACFTKKGLNKRNVLHELYHHIVNNKELEISEKKEEREASRFVRKIMRKSWYARARSLCCRRFPFRGIINFAGMWLRFFLIYCYSIMFSNIVIRFIKELLFFM